MYVHTVLDTDNLRFPDEFLDFPVQADADIHANALRFSTRFHCIVRKIPRGRIYGGRNSARIRVENETQ